ncbi:MAG: hypothetical protein GXY07_08820 [Candidatus Hydrogenedentes bacterium]|jgi:uncharacterized protein (DUF608 family)|nr:hypothetical protein [Candidatus Hydrogenedentota bacterium]
MTLFSLHFLLAALTANPMFDASADAGALQCFAVEGLNTPACGTVYGAGVLVEGGMPLGGIGTGYVCFDPEGRLGKCSIFNHYPAPMVLGKPFLSLTTEEKTYSVATPLDGVGDAKAVHYFGHFPVAEARYELDVPLRVEVRAYSPFLPGDAAESNTPAAVFEVFVTNLADAARSVTLSFSPEGFPGGEATPFAEGVWQGIQLTHAPLQRLPEWIRHTWAVAVEGGVVENTETGIRASATLDMAPGERKSATFILAWHQPWLRESSGRVEKHFYAGRFEDARAVAMRASERREDWLRRILSYQSALYGEDLPDWMKETLITAPYALTKNSLWIARQRPDDWWGDEGLFLVNESFSTCSITETMPCRFFGHWPALFFFPELELTTLKAIRHFQLRGGEPPFCLGLAFGIRDARYHCQHTCGAGEYAQIIYRYYLRTGDKAFFDDFYDSARDSVNFMMSLDKDGDGLVEDHVHAIPGETFPANNPMDNWPWYGASSYTAGKGLGALVCGIKMADLAGDEAQAAQWRDTLTRGQRAYEDKLWTGSYYRVYNDPATGRVNDACPAMQLSGVWSTRVLGLPDALPEDHIQKALDTILKLNVPASPYGMVNGVYPDGRLCEEGGGSGIPDTMWSRDIFIQCNATAAMVYLYYDRAEDGSAAARGMVDTIFRGPHAMPWAQPCGLSSKTGGTCHGHDYYDHMVVWSYPLAFAGQDIAGGCAPGGVIDRLLKAAR